MKTEVVAGADAFDALAPVWDQLVDRSMTATPFQLLAYQKAWWTHLGPGDLYTIALRDDSEQVCAIACFYLLDGILYFNGCVEETDYLDLIVPTERAQSAWKHVFAVLESPQFPGWKAMSLCNVPEASPTRAILESIAAERGLGFHTEVQDVCPVICLPNTFDAYLMDLDKKQRHEIRRKLRRASAAQAEIAIVQDADKLASSVDKFLHLLQLSTTEKEDWLNEGRRAVFHEVAAATRENGILQLMFLKHRQKEAAALFNFDYKGRIWVYNSGLDIGEFGHLSPGVVLTAQAIELAIEEGKDAFDFLRGDEAYKYRFGAEDTLIYRLRIERR